MALRQSGADGVMIGRGAYGRPWLIAQVMSELGGGGHRPDPSLDEQLETMIEQYDDMLAALRNAHGRQSRAQTYRLVHQGPAGLGGAAQHASTSRTIRQLWSACCRTSIRRGSRRSAA